MPHQPIRGCANCKSAAAWISSRSARIVIAIQIQKVEHVRAVASGGVMSIPAVVIDGTVVHAGGIPAGERVEQRLKSMGRSCGSSSKSCCG